MCGTKNTLWCADECRELADALLDYNGTASSKAAVHDEVVDVLFTIDRVCSDLGISPEILNAYRVYKRNCREVLKVKDKASELLTAELPLTPQRNAAMTVGGSN